MAFSLRFAPSTEQKLFHLGQAAMFDLSCACGTEPSRKRGVDGRWIYPAALPKGGRAPMLKVLQHGGCERGCNYCAQRHGGVGAEGGGQDPLSFTPDELARLFDDLYRRRAVMGLFLSSAIHGNVTKTMDRMLATASLLRRKYRYRGYLHLKLLPGCRPDHIERAFALATRLSMNMEAPSANHLVHIAPFKHFERHILRPMQHVARAIEEERYRRSGQTTQFVVGATSETDREIGHRASWLYKRLKLTRVYYSAFQPIAGTPLAEKPPAPFMREHRLYQMDYLLRSYGFSIGEVPFSKDGQLSLETDPKTLWARRHPERFPLEINTASAAELIRVPGIGPLSTKRLIRLRRDQPIRSIAALRAVGASWQIAAPYILLDGKLPRIARQLQLF